MAVGQFVEAGEDLVEQAQHLRRGHVGGHGREAHDVGEQHRDLLASHGAERLVTPRQLIDHGGREVAGEVRAFAGGAGLAHDERLGAPHDKREDDGAQQQEHELLDVHAQVDVGGIEGASGRARIAGIPQQRAGLEHDPDDGHGPGERRGDTGPEHEGGRVADGHVRHEQEQVADGRVPERHLRRAVPAQHDRHEHDGEHDDDGVDRAEDESEPASARVAQLVLRDAEHSQRQDDGLEVVELGRRLDEGEQHAGDGEHDERDEARDEELAALHARPRHQSARIAS